MRARATIVLVCAAVCLCGTAAAQSAGPAGLVVIPHPASRLGLSYFKLGARPGQKVQAGTVELRNPTARTQRVVLAAVDGVTLDTLGSTYRPPGSRSHGSTLWLRIARHTVAVPARGSAVVPIAIAVPRGARAGDYLSGVSIEALHQRVPSSSRQRMSVASAVRYAIGVEISLPGPRHPLIRFTAAKLASEPTGLVFTLDAGNLGNAILLGVHGHVRIARGDHTILSRPIDPGTFLAHTAIAYPVPAFGQQPGEGTGYQVRAWMRYRGGIARLDTSVDFGHRAAVLQQSYGGHAQAGGKAAVAWWKAALLAAALLYGLLTTILLLRRRRRREETPPDVPLGEELERLLTKH
jgi:hypothetical protein